MITRIRALIQKYPTVLIWTTATVIISILLVTLIIIPQIVQISNTRNEVSQKQTKITSFQKKVKLLSDISKGTIPEMDKDFFKRSLTTALVALPTEKNIPALVDEIQLLLSKNNLQLLNIEVAGGAPEEGNDLHSFQVTLRLTGSTASLKNFMDQVKNAPIVISLTGLSISASGGGLIENDLTLTTYFKEAPTSLGNIDQPVSIPTDSDRTLISSFTDNVKKTQLLTVSPGGNRGRSNPFQ